MAYQSSAVADLRRASRYPTTVIFDPAASFGRLRAFTTVDFAAGVDFTRFGVELFLQNAFDSRGQISRFQECGSCTQRPYIVPIRPQTIGVRLHTDF